VWGFGSPIPYSVTDGGVVLNGTWSVIKGDNAVACELGNAYCPCLDIRLNLGNGSQTGGGIGKAGCWGYLPQTWMWTTNRLVNANRCGRLPWLGSTAMPWSCSLDIRLVSLS